MTKGQHVRSLISQGKDNDYIVRATGSTLNSVRWHRSKMKSAAPAALPIPTKRLMVKDVVTDAQVETIIHGIMKGAMKTRGDAEHYWQRVSKWNFVYGKNLGGRFGQCHYGKRRIEVHEGIKGMEYDFHETLLHEIAHALAYLIYEKSCGHQWQWKDLMRAMDLPTSMYGNPSEAARAVLKEIRLTKRAQRKPYQVWECECCGYRTEVYAKRKYPVNCYKHSKCGGRFFVVGS